MDACIGKLIVRNMVMENKETLAVDEIVESTKYIANILRNEYLMRDPRTFPG